MTVLTTTNLVLHTGNGVTTAFPVPYPFIEPSNLLVSLVSGGVATMQALGTDYTVTGGEVTGTVTFVVPPPNGVTVRILRFLDPTQEADYTPTGTFPAETHERALDKLTMLIQQLINALGGSDVLSVAGRFLPFNTIIGKWDGGLERIGQLLPGVDSADAVTVGQAIGLLGGAAPVDLSLQQVVTHDGDAIETVFELTGIRGKDPKDISVFVSGIRQEIATYSVINNGADFDDISFSSAPPSGTGNIEITVPSGAALVAPPDLSVGTGAIQDGAVTPPKIAPGNNGEFMRTSAGAAGWATIQNTDVVGLQGQINATRISTIAPPDTSVAFAGQRITGLGASVDVGDAVNRGELDTRARTFASGVNANLSAGQVVAVGFNARLVMVHMTSSGMAFSTGFVSNVAKNINIASPPGSAHPGARLVVERVGNDITISGSWLDSGGVVVTGLGASVNILVAAYG